MKPAMDDEGRVVNVAREIRRYLETHPQSFDSLEGIATWWVLRQRIQAELDLVRAALVRLETRGEIYSAKIGHRCEPVYRLTDKQH
jgi:hypothetical protein